MKKLILLPVLMAATLATATTYTAYAPPVGGMTVTVPAGQTRSWTIPLLHGSVGAGATLGRIQAVGSNYIDDPSAGWTAGAFSTAANPYYLRIKTGAAAGRVMIVSSTANTTSRVFLNTDGTDLTLAGIVTGASGDVYELVLADTLFDLFGNSTLQGGPDATTADNVQVWSGAAWLIFYYNTTDNRWERNTDTSISPTRNTFQLRPDRGVMIVRRAATALTMYVMGRVPDTDVRYFHARPGVTFLNLGFPSDTTLGALAMQSHALGWVGGTGASDSDVIQVWSGAAWLSFYYNAANSVWRRDGDPTNRDTFAIPAGRPIMVKRLNAGATAYDGLIPMSLPYTIN